MKEIGFVGGYWSTNIGNSFFNIGAQFVLQKIFPFDRVRMISDQPGYWTFWNKKKGNPRNALDLIGSYSLDYLVLLGPCLTETFGALWEKSLEKLFSRGTKLIILSAGQMKYTEQETESARKVLQKYKPYILSSRDRETYENFHDCAEHSYDGIDLACFVSDIYRPNNLNIGKYITLNLDKLPEPDFAESNSMDDAQITIEGKSYILNFPKLRNSLCEKSDVFRYIDSFLPFRTNRDHIEDHKIIRIINRFNPMVTKRVYQEKNSFVSDIPYSYLDLFANSEVTVTDRVHSCVASLVYGKSAILCKKTGRSKLLDRIGAEKIQEKNIKINQEFLVNEKNNLINTFVKWVL